MQIKWFQFKRIRTRLVVTYTALALFSTAILFVALYLFFSYQFLQSLRASLANQVGIAALQVDGDLHATLKTPDDENTAAYQQVLASLVKIHDAGTGISYPYTMRMASDGQILFIVDATQDDPAIVGDVYADPGPVLTDHYSTITHPTVEDNIYTDEYGTWLTGYAPILRSDGQIDGVLAIDIDAAQILAKEHEILLIGLIIFLGVIPISIVFAFLNARGFVKPVSMISKTVSQIAKTDLPDLKRVAEAVAQGDLTHSISAVQTAPIDITSKDELGSLGEGLNQIIDSMSKTSQAVNQMTLNLHDLVGEVTDHAVDLSLSSAQLTAASEQTGLAAGQITASIQQVTEGTSIQLNSMTQTRSSVEHMVSAISGVARGAQGQASAVGRVANLTQQINNAAQQVAGDASLVTQESEKAAQLARSGANVVEQTILGMQRIKSRVGASAEKVQELGKRSGEIGLIARAIEEIASQTNLLAINAAIETARLDSQANIITETILDHQMLAQAHLMNQILLDNHGNCPPTFWTELACQAKLDSICITDGDGVIEYSEDPKLLGFRFPEDPKSQTYEFRKLINQTDGFYCQKTQVRSFDKRMFKYVGVTRKDKPGIVQVAFDSDTIREVRLNVGGIAVVADEVRKLSERATASTKEIAELIKNIQKTVNESMAGMNDSVREVDAGVNLSTEAGSALSNILTAVESVYQQINQTKTATQQMTKAINDLLHEMDSVSLVVESNTVATEEMSASSNEVAQAVGSITKTSSENTEALEDINTGTEEMNAQVEELAASAHLLSGMVEKLHQSVAKFRLKEGEA